MHEKEFSYFPDGLVKDIKELGANNNTYTSLFEYDSYKRLITAYYPNISLAYTYNDFNSITQITQTVLNTPTSHRTIDIAYGVDQQRIKMEYSSPTSAYASTTYYIGSSNMEIRGTAEFTYLYDPSGAPFAIHKKTGETGEIYYLHLDHLGSIMAISNEAGGIVEKRSEVYPERSLRNAWGRHRHPNTWDYLVMNPFGMGGANDITLRGYTFHVRETRFLNKNLSRTIPQFGKHLPHFSLINMNGRLYDYVLGRMLSPDNYVQSPDNTQSFNRYSYCWNNPLKYTDPSGEIIFTAAVLIAAPFTGGASLALLPYAVGADVGMWQGGTMANGTMNPLKWDYGSGKTWGYMAGGAAIGAGSSYIGGAGASAIFKSTSIGANHVLFGATSGAISGAASGFGMGGLSGVHQNGKWDWNSAWKGAGMGAAGGFILGGVSTAIGNKIAGRHWWNGKTLAERVKFVPPGIEAYDESVPDELNSISSQELGTAEFPSGNVYDTRGNLISGKNYSIEKYYMPNDGFDEVGFELLELKKNTVLGRYGGEGGNYLTNPKTPEGFLNLPGGAQNRAYTEYIVNKPFTIKYGGVNWGLGNSKQYLSPESINWLLKNKYLILK